MLLACHAVCFSRQGFVRIDSGGSRGGKPTARSTTRQGAPPPSCWRARGAWTASNPERREYPFLSLSSFADQSWRTHTNTIDLGPTSCLCHTRQVDCAEGERVPLAPGFLKLESQGPPVAYGQQQERRSSRSGGSTHHNNGDQRALPRPAGRGPDLPDLSWRARQARYSLPARVRGWGGRVCRCLFGDC
jgi:hypothetical protein